MPASPAQGGKAFTLAKANPYDTTSVRDKIKKWQVDGGGVLQEVVAVADSDKESKAGSGSGTGSSSSGSGAKTRSHGKSKSVGEVLEVVVIEEQESTAPRSELSKASLDKLAATQAAQAAAAPRIIERKPKANILSEEVRDAIAPKKRIVSDGHWRRKHVDPNAAPPSPPKSPPKKEPQYGWVRPPLLTRPGGDDALNTSPPKKLKPGEEEPMKTYTGKGKTKPIVTQIHSQLSMRPKDSVPIPIPTPKTPTTPVRIRRMSHAEPKAKRPVKSDGDSPPKSEPRPSRRAKSEDDSPPKTARSNPGRTVAEKTRQFESAYASQDERPTRRRLSKSRKTESEGYKSGPLVALDAPAMLAAQIQRQSLQKIWLDGSEYVMHWTRWAGSTLRTGKPGTS